MQLGIKKYGKVRYWCEDESRLGLITLGARKITAKGIQPLTFYLLPFTLFCISLK
jgi:hypothetical protein